MAARWWRGRARCSASEADALGDCSRARSLKILRPRRSRRRPSRSRNSTGQVRTRRNRRTNGRKARRSCAALDPALIDCGFNGAELAQYLLRCNARGPVVNGMAIHWSFGSEVSFTVVAKGRPVGPRGPHMMYAVMPPLVFPD